MKKATNLKGDYIRHSGNSVIFCSLAVQLNTYVGMANRKGYIDNIDQLIYRRVYIDMSDILGEITMLILQIWI